MGKSMTYFSETGTNYPCNSENSYREKDGKKERITPLRYLDPATASKLIKAKQNGASSAAIIHVLPKHSYDRNGGSLAYTNAKGEIHFSGPIKFREPPFPGELEKAVDKSSIPKTAPAGAVSENDILDWLSPDSAEEEPIPQLSVKSAAKSA